MTMLFPKPEKPVRGTAACRNHMGLVAQLPCVCCGISPVQVHHCIHGRHAQRKSSDFDTIPLCPRHHDMLHNQPDAWRLAYGTDEAFLPMVREAVDRLRDSIIGGR